MTISGQAQFPTGFMTSEVGLSIERFDPYGSRTSVPSDLNFLKLRSSHPFWTDLQLQLFDCYTNNLGLSPLATELLDPDLETGDTAQGPQ